MRKSISIVCFIAFTIMHQAVVETLNADINLAMTPPMGWNSWNAFEKDIDEEKIKAIADAMVTSASSSTNWTYM